MEASYQPTETKISRCLGIFYKIPNKVSDDVQCYDLHITTHDVLFNIVQYGETIIIVLQKDC